MAESRLARWGRLAVRRRRAVLGGWVVGLAVLGAVVAGFGGQLANEFKIPGVDSQRAYDLLAARFPSQSGDTAQVVVRADAGVADPAVRARVDALLAEVAALPQVTGVVSPYDNPAAVSADGRIAYATVQYGVPASDLPLAEIETLTGLIDRAGGNGLTVEAGGQVVAQGEFVPPGESTLIAIAAAVVVLLIAFGSLVAMGLPILTALIGLGAGFAGVFLSARFLDIADFTPAIASMIGLGVGIDYALFVVTRYREGLAEGLSVEAAVGRAVDTAGRAVIFAGGVVVIALLGLFAVGIPFVAAFGAASAIVVAFSVLVAVTLLPALLGFAGTGIDRLRVPGLRRLAGGGQPVGGRLARRIQARPLGYAISAAALLLLLAAPLLDIQLGFADNGSNPTSFHTRRAYDLLSEGFGPGFNGPLVVAVEQEGGGALDQAALGGLTEALRGAEGIASVSPATLNQAGDTAVISVIPTTSPQDTATEATIRRLRDDVIDGATAGTGLAAYVGGATATFIDLGDKTGERTPLFFAIVVGLSFLLLAAVFRSVVIALKAALMNLLSIGAAYGVIVAVFQWGWGASLLGVEETAPIAPFLPMFLFSILFGLSMDYEVFLLSRIREFYVRGRATHDAVADGLSATARVITAAAAIMVVVFLSFVFTDDQISKQFGLGLAVAVLVDATVVRLILVPATMELLGEWNWWFPSWLDRLVPRLNIEGGSHAPEPLPAGSPGD